MKIAGRTDEIQVLQKQLKQPQSSFAAVYGRRRIGKTFLIRQAFAKHLVFDCSGLHERNIGQQLENFQLALDRASKKKRWNNTPASWLQAFNRLQQYIAALRSAEKKVIFLDEISWFDTQKSGFKAALDNFWNHFASKRSDIILVICGSAASWIINKVINDRGGLHNRITCKIALQPFTLQETAAFLQLRRVDFTYKDIVQLYMAVGGIPFYLNEIEPGQSLPQVIQQLFFTKNAKLKNEFDNLYAALFKNAGDHIAIIKALAAKNKGLTRNEIIKQTKLSSGGGLTHTLQELISCGFIKEIYPVNKAKEDILFRLLDEYSIFYFKFIDNNRGNTRWSEISSSPSYKTWCGYAFENVCLRHIDEIKRALGISGISSSEYSWQIKGNSKLQGAQIDLIIDRNDNCINLCEAKFYNDVFETTKAYADQLRTKRSAFIAATKTRKNIFITLITVYGADLNKYFNSIVTSQMVTDVFFK